MKTRIQKKKGKLCYQVNGFSLHANTAIKKGFRFVEVISPCPTLFERKNRLGSGLDRMKNYKAKSVKKKGANTREVGISFEGDIVVGKFVDRERPTFTENRHKRLQEVLGNRYVKYEGL
jgi:2-oxoglutarate ferredoxin oxidoreductase subunit beta